MPAFFASARLITGAIFGSIAGVLLFLVLVSLPATAVLFGVLWCLQHLLGRLDGIAQIVWNVFVMLSMAGVSIVGAVLGSVVGWGVGSRMASGSSLSRSMESSRCLARVPFVRSRNAA